MSEIVWEDPPPRPQDRSGGLWRERLEPLMKRKGVWARFHESPTQQAAAGAASQLRNGRLTRPAGQWEFASRSIDGKNYIYARYLGPEE